MVLSMAAKVGIVAFLAIAILGTIIVWKGDIFLKYQGYELIGVFDNIGGLGEGSDVRYRGYKVGKVMKIEPGIKDIRVYFKVAPNVAVPEGSHLRIAFDGLIGTKYIEIMPSESKVILKPLSELRGINTLGIVDFVDVGTQNLEESKRILTSVRKTIEDPVTQRVIKETLVNIEATSADLARVSKSLSKAMAAGGVTDLISTLRISAEQIAKVTSRLDSITKALDQLTADPKFIGDIRETAKNANEAAIEVREAAKRASKALERYIK